MCIHLSKPLDLRKSLAHGRAQRQVVFLVIGLITVLGTHGTRELPVKPLEHLICISTIVLSHGIPYISALLTTL